MKLHKAQAFLLILLLVWPALCSSATRSTPADDIRITRLIGLARVWGAVKYFHPYLAYRNIDWDRALVEAIPKVNAARSSQEYAAAVQQMLAVLNDKSTRASVGPESPAGVSTMAAVSKQPIRTENGLLIIDASQIAVTIAADNSSISNYVEQISQAVTTAKGIIIDARGERPGSDGTAYYFDVFLRRILPTLLDTNVILGSIRYRLHNGYATQTGNGASFYYSAFTTSAPETLPGRAKTKSLPVVFIVNSNSPSFTDMLSGMQSANRALVIQEGDGAQDSSSASIDLPDHVRVRLKTFELVNPDGSIEFQPDAIVSKNATADLALNEAIKALQDNKVEQTRTRKNAPPATLATEHDNPYPEMTYPAVEYRLLALFRFWNVVNYFYPYRSLIGPDWATVLQRYISKFESNKDALDYQFTVRELVAETHDSHSSVQNANASNEKLGTFMPPLVTRYIENQSVVTAILDPKLAVNLGDVVLSVDDEPIEKRREFLSRFIAASTPQALMRSVHSRLLRGQKDSVAKLRVRGPSGAVREVSVPRSLPVTDARMFATGRTAPVYQVLPGGYGYVDLARLQVGEVDKMFEMVRTTAGLIFDMRGYPNGTAWAIAPRLTERENVVAALFSRPFLEATALSSGEFADSASYSFAQKIPPRSGDVYKGKVVMLINEDAISQSEHTCLFFEAATDVTFIGTPTTGANGDVTFMVLPGNLSVSFTGHNVRHADGRQLQRVGIQPTIRVEPTIRGIVEGRDEILEAGVRFLQKSVSGPSGSAVPE